MPIITLTTDFGQASRYVAQMKGVLLSEASGATLVDLSHEVAPQDIAAGARLLEDSAPWYPAGTVHLAVVDPGVGAGRLIVAIESEGQRYVGPDNGLFGWLTDKAEAVVVLDPVRFDPQMASATFHGRDLMAPAAALLASGSQVSDLGEPHEPLMVLPESNKPTRTGEGIDGYVVEVDRFGNLITNIKPSLLGDAPLDERLRVACGEHETLGLQITYAHHPPQTLVALVGSTGYIELAIVNGDAATMLDARVGDPVTIGWER